MKYLTWLSILLVTGCQSMPKDPKKPDTSPRVPINKTIPPEIQANGWLPAECRPEEGIYEHPAN